MDCFDQNNYGPGRHPVIFFACDNETNGNWWMPFIIYSNSIDPFMLLGSMIGNY